MWAEMIMISRDEKTIDSTVIETHLHDVDVMSSWQQQRNALSRLRADWAFPYLAAQGQSLTQNSAKVLSVSPSVCPVGEVTTILYVYV